MPAMTNSSDIVEWLRNHAYELRQAADEIKRLRRDYRELRDTYDRRPDRETVEAVVQRELAGVQDQRKNFLLEGGISTDIYDGAIEALERCLRALLPAEKK